MCACVCIHIYIYMYMHIDYAGRRNAVGGKHRGAEGRPRARNIGPRGGKYRSGQTGSGAAQVWAITRASRVSRAFAVFVCLCI